MEKEKFFVIGRASPISIWQVLTLQTEDYSEAMEWYSTLSKKRKLYCDIKIAKTIYGLPNNWINLTTLARCKLSKC